MQDAWLCGAERIVAVDRVPAKLDLARVFGATEAGNVMAAPTGMAYTGAGGTLARP